MTEGNENMPAEPSRADVRLSRFLSFVLRHGPDSIGLELDKNGWADVGELIRKAKSAKRVFKREDLDRVVHGGPRTQLGRQGSGNQGFGVAAPVSSRT